MLKRSALLFALPLALGACSTQSTASGVHGTPAAAERGMVSAADPRAAEAGAQILRQGGSASDAAIATMLALTVVEPQSSGIGGGGFLVRGTAEGAVSTLDGRETAPAAAGEDWFLDAQGKPLPFLDAVISGRSVGVPGNIRLAALAHHRYGKLAWADLFTPAIALAEDGFAVTPRFHSFLERAKNRAAHTAEGAALFYDAAGAPKPVGTVIRNPALAETLRQIATQGADSFYSPENAQALARVIADATPGDARMAESDITGYEAKERPPVCASYRLHRICGMGPPSSGATTVFAILKQLEGFDLASLGPQDARFWHLLAESERLAYADRELYLADSDFIEVPVQGLVNEAYLAKRGGLIAMDSTMAVAEAGIPPVWAAAPIALAPGNGPEEKGTSHFVAVDRWGNSVSYTSTVEGPFGSGIMHGGYFLNNELTDFSFIPEKGSLPVANRVEGGKRPRSSMSPTVVYGPDGTLVLAIGAAGGSTIPSQVAKALIGYIDFGLSAQDAIALPVLYAPGDTVLVEEGTFLEAMVPELERLGHARVMVRSLPFKANAVERKDGRWVGAADPRSEGVAISE